ncbi:MAG: phosphoglycerate kinase [Methermicoccaceae archaeon]
MRPMQEQYDYLTLSDIELSEKSVLMRVDVNSPMDPSGTILDDMRFRSHLPTLKELSECKVVLLAHQSRPGKSDFTTMMPHARLLSRLLGRRVMYVDDIFGSNACSKIEELDWGDVLMLENVRFYSEEMLKRPAEEHATTHMVRRLAPHFDLFVNDAFSVSHRAHLSVIGFTPRLPSYAGRVVERELHYLGMGVQPDVPVLFVLGGAKADDSLKVMKSTLETNPNSRVLTTGLVANLLLHASGVNLGEPNVRILTSTGLIEFAEAAKRLLDEYGDRIELPIDFGVDVDGRRENVLLKHMPVPHQIKDIGIETMARFSEEIKNAEVVVMNGPAGVIEEGEYKEGTFELLRAATKARCSLIGGGHISAAVDEAKLKHKLTHVSTGGGAAIQFLSEKTLVGIEALKSAAERERGRINRA